MTKITLDPSFTFQTHSLPQRNGPKSLVVETDTSDITLLETLGQNTRPAAFFSRMLNEAVLSFSEKEAATIAEALMKWKLFLIGREFKLNTNQQTLSFVFDKKHKNKIKNFKFKRWYFIACALPILVYKIVHWPGKANEKANLLSYVSAICNIVE